MRYKLGLAKRPHDIGFLGSKFMPWIEALGSCLFKNQLNRAMRLGNRFDGVAQETELVPLRQSLGVWGGEF